MVDIDKNQQLKRTLLYYPSIVIPDGPWLRQALLYWDEVSAIVPTTWETRERVSFSPEIEFLRSEGEFRPIRPEVLQSYDAHRERSELESSFRALVESEHYKRIWKDSVLGREYFSHIYQDKIAANLFFYLQDKKLAKFDESHPGWYLFEKRIALLYMSLLAKHLARFDSQRTIPGTDQHVFESLAFGPLPEDNGCSMLKIRYLDILPTPREDIPLSDIIEFKHKHRAELLRFRGNIAVLQAQVSRTQDIDDVKEALTNFRENIELDLADLSGLLKDRRISTTTGSFKTVVSLNSPTLWGGLAVVAGEATKIAELPIEWTMAGLGVTGLIQVAKHLVDSRIERRQTLSGAPLSYLYHAKRHRVI